jgi:hypothetical protein
LLSVTLMSDLLFSIMLFIALSLLQRAETGRRVAVAGLLGGVAYLTRVAALPLLAAGPLWLVWRRRPRHAALFLAAMLPAVCGWTLWVRAHLRPSTDLMTLYYTDYIGYQWHGVALGDLPLRLLKNVAFLLAAVAQLLTSQVGDFYWRLFAFAALAGTVRLAQTRGLTPCHLYGALLLVMVCAWLPEARYLVPALPLLAAGLWCELGHLVGLLRAAWRKGSRAPVVAMGGALAVSGAVAAYFLGLTLFRFLPETFAERRQILAARRDAYRWIVQQTPPDAAFVAYDDTVLYLYTGRPAVTVRVPTRLYYEENAEAFVRLHSHLDQLAGVHGLSYLFATREDYYRGEVPTLFRERARRAAAENYRSRMAYRNPAVVVYRIAPAEPPQPLRHSAISVSEMAPSRMTRQ